MLSLSLHIMNRKTTKNTGSIKYPIGIQDFASLINGGYLYVDKTQFIMQLTGIGKYFFLSRPRRFGKSLFLSTLRAYYEGRRELFSGLAVDKYDHDWTPRPVMHLMFNDMTYNTPEALLEKLNFYISSLEKTYDCAVDIDSPSLRFGNVIRNAATRTGQKVVILIDEYDKPLLDTVDDPHLQQQMRDILKGLYGNLKAMDEFIEFAMLTGVTRFGKLSIFSDINNLRDISLNPDFSDICGITTDEIDAYFRTGIEKFAEVYNISYSDALALLKENYDGYCFAPGGKDIYNPFSILSALADRRISNYWYDTGTPSFLIKMIRSRQLRPRDVESMKVQINSLRNSPFDLGNFAAVMYQSGYLTIKDFDPRFDTVTLGYPDREVAQSLTEQLLAIQTHDRTLQSSEFALSEFVKDLENGDAESFMTRLQSLFAQIQYDQIDLGHLGQTYQNVVYLLSKLMGYYTKAEMRTSQGRIDLVVATPEYIYIFEFKVDSTPQVAMEQIDSRGHLLPFKANGRQLVKIGANFSTRTRTLDSWLIQYDTCAGE